ncbi:TetR/AcrR family transcriptional regulator [Paenibacillus barcinonensis]|uniref:TetR/AcrR family transcriptional regulator n=1 Tax=Paenibacillus barcinonensis TaxID=198119 RepID=UPI001C11E5D6|nr:TetR/AcrR family transcriptional regulator [Paenibacillus barcinonensis]MBU5351745.1 TetR/AcrR family transcriptional regulator [Paenibacillus barcinonensis]
MKNEDRRKQTTEQLLKATKELLRDKGCHSITLKEIMERSGLSKGAIFHYVKTKDEIFVWILLEHLDMIHEAVLNNIAEAEIKTFEGPMQIIAANLSGMEDRELITNKVLAYLLGKEDDPEVSKALQQFYDTSVKHSAHWIELGQQHQVINRSVDANSMGELFVLLSTGLRVRSFMKTNNQDGLKPKDIASFMAETLRTTTQ